MKRLLSVILILVLVKVTWAAWSAFKIPSPGATGMNSTADVQEMRPTDARLLSQMDAVAAPGAILTDYRLASWGTTVTRLYSAFGYNDPDWGTKALLAIRKCSTMVGPMKINGQAFAYSLPDSIGVMLSRSADYGTNATTNTVNTTALFAATTDIRWLQFGRELFIMDGVNAPRLYLHYKGTPQDSHLVAEETETPTLLLTEAPGQLHATIVDYAGGTLNPGTYTYRYRYCDTSFSAPPADSVVIDSVGKPSLESDPVKIENTTSSILLSGFEGRPFGGSSTTADLPTWIILERKVEAQHFWTLVDRIKFQPSVRWVYLDSGFSTYIVQLKISDTIPVPGALKDYRNIPVYAQADTFHCPGDANHALDADSFWIAYSYYDPISGFETALGPHTKAKSLIYNAVGIGCDSVFKLLWKGYTNTEERASTIRVYRSAAGDSTVMYGMYQLSATHPYPTSQYGMGIRPGDVSDAELIGGLDSGCCDTLYYGHDLFTDAGVAVARPPFVTTLSIPFSQMVFFGNRAWGIGDPLFRQRLYYSEPSTPHSWAPTDYLALAEEENDEIVAIATIDNQSALYPFKHGSIYLVTGYDPEYDLQLQRLSDVNGAANGNVVVTATPYVYWLGNNGRFYRMAGGTAEPISLAVQSTIDSMFPTERIRRNHAHVVRWNDRLILTNDSTSEGLYYWYLDNVWTKLPPFAASPIITVQYDTARTEHTLPFNSDKLIFDGVAGLSIQDTVRGTRVIVGTDTNSAPAVYQTPFIGDGKQQWQMSEAQITATGTVGAYLKAQVIDDRDSVLATDSLLFSSASDYRLGFGVNVGKYLSVKFTSGSTCADLKLGEVVLYATPVGTIGLR